ncbi:MAG: DEAD/DEAH box helicase, partial [Armatimonadetes bacterium]|nr:DEAD/DEAH box helicase [Armatimonadota bacterium]
LPLSEIRANLLSPDGTPRYRVPLPAPIEYAPQDAPTESPYIFGESLATTNAASRGVSRETQPSNDTIPLEYRLGSVSTRLAVLRGLMDVGGSVVGDNTLWFVTASVTLAGSVCDLIRSLGGTARIIPLAGTNDFGTYPVEFQLPPDIVPSTKKKMMESYRPVPADPCRYIVDIEPVGEKETQCIRVEAADHLYVTDDFIVTHNTLSALSFLLSLRKAGGNDHATTPDLVIAPKSLVFNWEREAARFTPGLKTLVYTEGNRAKDPSAFEGVDVVLTTYGIMLRDIEHLRKTRFHYTVLDEAQAIKNPLSQSARAARLLNTEHRLTLTGTPVENGTIELWSQFAFLNPGHLGNIESFKKEFAGAIEQDGDEEAAQTLRRLIAPFLLRRTKAQVAPELPARTEQIVYCEMDKTQRKRYEETRDRYRAEVMGLLDEAETDRSQAGRGQMKMLEALLRLRQVCNHPRLADKTYEGDSAKFGVLMDTIETLRAENHKALVFSQFVQMLDIIRAELDKRGVPYCYLDGSTRDRRAPVDKFQ